MDDDQGIDLREVRKKYNRLDKIWALDDPWHLQASRRYDQEIQGFFDEYNHKGCVVLNIGSGDKVYNTNSFLVNIDISERFLNKHSNPICASATSVPLATGVSDGVICIGSVVNYCDAIFVISEIGRILKHKGKAFVEFESSESFEYYGSGNFGKIASIIDTKYGNIDDKIWIYKPSYIQSILELSGMKVLSVIRVHTLSSVIYRITRSERVSSVFCAFDRFFANTPLKKYSANVIFVCQKL